MRRFTTTVVMIGLLAGPAYAQGGRPKSDQKTPMELIEAKKAQDAAEIDRQYNVMKKTPRAQDAAAAKPDPWGNMRTVSPPREKR